MFKSQESQINKLKNFKYKKITNIISQSFVKSWQGQESFRNIVIYWGFIAYLMAIILDKIIIKTPNFIDNILSIIAIIYFSWHIIITYKITPKKPKLSKEEKKKQKEQEKTIFTKNLIQKLLLQKSWTNFNQYYFVIALDLFCFAHFLGYFLS